MALHYFMSLDGGQCPLVILQLTKIQLDPEHVHVCERTAHSFVDVMNSRNYSTKMAMHICIFVKISTCDILVVCDI